MWIHGCAQLRLHPRLPTEEVYRFARYGLGPIVAREEPGARFISLPILPEQSEQTRGEHHAAILLPFPLADTEHHTGTIDISDLQVTEFRDPQAGRIEGREHRPRFEAARGQEQGGDCRLTEDGGEGLGPLGLGKVDKHGRLTERHVVEKAQRTDRLHDEGPGDVAFVDQIELILADVIRTKPLW